MFDSKSIKKGSPTVLLCSSCYLSSLARTNKVYFPWSLVLCLIITKPAMQKEEIRYRNLDFWTHLDFPISMLLLIRNGEDKRIRDLEVPSGTRPLFQLEFSLGNIPGEGRIPFALSVDFLLLNNSCNTYFLHVYYIYIYYKDKFPRNLI